MSWKFRRFASRVFTFAFAALVLVVVAVPSAVVANTDQGPSDSDAGNFRFGSPDWTPDDPPVNGRRPLAVETDAAGRPSAWICLDPSDGSSVPCPARSGHDYAPPGTAPTQSVTDNSDWTMEWMVLTAAILTGLAIVGVVADLLGRRRWHRPPLEAALASSDPDELPRAAGLLGDRFAEQSRADAAEHAYRAAIDADHECWSPRAQIALAQLLTDRGDLDQAQRLLEDAIAAGDARTVPLAQTSLHKLVTGHSRYEALTVAETLDSTRPT